MNLKLIYSMVIISTFASTTASLAATMKASFYSAGKSHNIEIDKENLAVRFQRGFIKKNKSIHPTEHERFSQIGISIVSKSAAVPQETIIGYPIWFNKEKHAVGILTHEIVVKLSDRKGLATLQKSDGFLAAVKTKYGKEIYVVSYNSPLKAMAAANALYSIPFFAYAHPNFIIPKDFRVAKSSEPFYSDQWHLKNTGQTGGTAGADINAEGAWGYTKGNSSVVVAVLDAGFQKGHPDLADSWLVNSGEIAGNNKDDDNNGYIDDVYGWSFYNKSGDVDAGSYGEHGVSVAGLVAARENGKGVVGSCPKCSLLPVVVSWAVEDDAEAFYYAKIRGADIITNSWGYPVGTPRTDVLEEAIADVAATGRDGKGTIILFAMNNIDQDDCVGSQPDISALETVIAVSAASDLDKKVSFSAWGNCMEFLSPSYESGRAHVATTDMMGDKGYNNSRSTGDLSDQDYTNDFGGTSAATPIAAGVFGLMLSVNADLTRDEALGLVLSTADKVHPNLANYGRTTGFSKKYGYGRINAEKAVRAAQVFRKYIKAPVKNKNIKM
jgi:subtilisin family serine protease